MDHSGFSKSLSIEPSKKSMSTKQILANIEQFIDPNWCNHGFQKMEEIRRLGKLFIELRKLSEMTS